MELHLYPDMVILPDFCFFVYSFAKKMTNKIPRKICKKVRQYTIYNNFLQFIKKYLHYLNISYIIGSSPIGSILGWIPEWPKGADCKSVSNAFEGSNPSPSIKRFRHLSESFFCYIIKRQPLLPQEAAVRVRRIRSSASHFVNFYDVRPLRQMPAL